MDRKNVLIKKISILFLENGFRSMTMDDTSSTLKISKKTLYELFGNKSQHITYCIEYILKDFKKIATINNDLATNALELFYMNVDQIKNINNYTAQQQNLRELEHYYKAIYNTEMPHILNTVYIIVDSAAVRGKNEGLFIEDYDYDMVSKIFVRGYFSSLIEINVAEENLDKNLETFIYHYIAGICTEKGRKILESKYKHQII